MRIALVGAGRWGTTHARSLKRLGYCLSAVVDPRREAAEAIARVYGCEGCRVYTSIDELSGVDAAIVSVPPEHLYSVSKRLIESGVHVLVEKPVATSHELAEELARLADEKGVVAAAGYLLRFHPVSDTLREYMASGGPCLIELVRIVPSSGRRWPVSLDLAVHDVDLVLWATGELRPILRLNGDERFLLVGESIKHRVVIYAARGAYKLRVARILCDEEAIEVNEDTFEAKLLHQNVSHRLPSEADPLGLEQRAFIESVERGRLNPRLASLWDAARVLRVIGY